RFHLRGPARLTRLMASAARSAHVAESSPVGVYALRNLTRSSGSSGPGAAMVVDAVPVLVRPGRKTATIIVHAAGRTPPRSAPTQRSGRLWKASDRAGGT